MQEAAVLEKFAADLRLSATTAALIEVATA
jgi:hypothetical protein